MRGLDSINLVQEMDSWQALKNVVMNFQVQ
jgi:hypothetical protein